MENVLLIKTFSVITMWEYFVQKCIKLERTVHCITNPTIHETLHCCVYAKKISWSHDRSWSSKNKQGERRYRFRFTLKQLRFIILKISACLWIDDYFLFHLIHLILPQNLCNNKETLTTQYHTEASVRLHSSCISVESVFVKL